MRSVRPVVLIDEPDTPLRRALPWAAACAATLLIHGYAFWYFTHERLGPTASPAAAPAAVMVDMSPIVQQAYSQNDGAVGQPMQEASEPPPPEPDTPDLTPKLDESPVDPVVPMPPKPPEKPKEAKVKRKTTSVKKAEREKASKPAARTASNPRSDSHAARTTASSAGSATSAAAASWGDRVRAAIERNKRYPAGQTASGSPYIRLTVSPSGFMSNVSIVASSGVPALDRAALDTVRRTSVSPPPPGVSPTLTFRMIMHP